MNNRNLTTSAGSLSGMRGPSYNLVIVSVSSALARNIPYPSEKSPGIFPKKNSKKVLAVTCSVIVNYITT